MQDEDKLHKLIHMLALTRGEEIDCTTCLKLLPMYVECELAGTAMQSESLLLRQHLAVCHDCLEEYEALRDIVHLEQVEGLPDRSSLLRELESQPPES